MGSADTGAREPQDSVSAAKDAARLTDPYFWRKCVDKGASEEQVADFARRTLAALLKERESLLAGVGEARPAEPEPDCGCAYELVEDGAVQRKLWFHEPGCPVTLPAGREPGQPQTGAYIAENEHGTPFLYFPDGGETDGFYRREATAAEVVFWAECRLLREQLDAAAALAKAILDFTENEVPDEWDGGSVGYSLGGICSMADELLAARAALGVVGPPPDRVAESAESADVRGGES